jgi:hypothetical protein
MDTNLGLLPQMPMVGRATPCAPRHMTFRRAEDCPPYPHLVFHDFERVHEQGQLHVQ